MDTEPARKHSNPTWSLIAGGILIAFGLPELNLGHRLAPGTGIGAALFRETVWWGMAGLLLVYILRVERLPLSSIGLRRPGFRTLLYGLLAYVLLFASVIFSYAIIFPAFGLKLNQQTVAQITGLPLWLQVLIFARAGVVEEILYRGYPIERLEKCTGSTFLAFLVSAVVFTIVHLASWGGAQLVVVGFAAVILGGWYVWRRDLLSNMLAHFLVDLTGFLLSGAHHR